MKPPIPGEPRAEPIVSEGDPWRGITEAEQVERIARGSTPKREYIEGRFEAWIRQVERREERV